MNKQEAIEKIKSKKILQNCLSNYGLGYNEALDEVIYIINQLDEPVKPPEPKPLEIEKPVVPQFVADWYEENKYYFEWNLYNFCVDFHERKLQKDLREWFADNTNGPIETLVMMHKFGYEIEKEKLYTVEIPNPNHEERPILFKKRDGKVHIIFPSVPCWRTVKNAQLTESEIKKDFAWAWEFAEEVKE